MTSEIPEQGARDQDLAEAREQLRATSEVLKVISRSSFELDPVLQTIVEHATRLCDAEQGFIFRRDSDTYRLAVAYQVSAAFTAWRQDLAARPGDGSIVGRVALWNRTVQILDAQDDREWLETHRDAQGVDDVRTLVGVPMLRAGVAIGVIAMWRTAVQPFTDRQIELVTTFADQAVIAVENVRLFRELESRNVDLAETLEQQMATGEMLRAISRSPTDALPVFEMIARSAVRLCDGQFSGVFRFDGDLLHLVAFHNLTSQSAEVYRRSLPRPAARETVIGRVILDRKIVHVPDVLADPEYGLRELAQTAGIRSIIGVPMMRDDKPIGGFVVWRSRPGLFAASEIALLSTFADQAVIAVENVRLFQDLQARNRDLSEALEQQTATGEILRTISRSPTDTLPVFETIVRNAVALCGSLFANVFRYDGELLHYAASHNTGPGYEELLRSKYPMSPDLSQVSGRVVLTGSIVRLEDARADPDYDQRFPTAIGWRRMLGVPLLREGRVLGVIVVGWAESGPVPKALEELLRTFADQAVIAIENVRLFEELQTKSSQLELANTYKSRFLAAASHDLRQPLHALNLFVAQLRAESDPAERNRLVTRIDAAVGGMNELFNSLLDMSKIEAGILDLNLTEFPVDRLLTHTETTFAEAARGKGLRLRVVPSRAWVCSDFILLERILLNLVSNAVRYTAHGGVVIGARRHGKRLRLDVWDSGVGIAEDQQQNIFREFYQVAGPEPGSRGGLGLGLAIVDRLSGLLDHTVELRSIPGRGSRFSVWVPLVTQRRESAPEAPIATAAIADPVAGKLIVVVDDDTLVLDGMHGLLASWGCQVVNEVSEGAVLARLAQRGQKPDLIISDYRLAGGKTGIDAIGRLRGALGGAIPAFLVSGDTAPERLRDAAASGFHLLHKPVSPMALRAILNRLLSTAA